MIKCVCDICGKEFTQANKGAKYKIKKASKWYKHNWETLDVHEECWKELCEVVKERVEAKN